jgi:hypothetical protein
VDGKRQQSCEVCGQVLRTEILPALPDEPAKKNGVIDGYLYINDVKQTRYKLVEFEGNYYFINDGDKVAVNTRLYLSASFVKGMTFADGSPIPVGYYRFDSEGKMILG